MIHTERGEGGRGHLCIQAEIQGALNGPRVAAGLSLNTHPLFTTQTWQEIGMVEGKERDFHTATAVSFRLDLYPDTRMRRPSRLTRPDFQAARPRVDKGLMNLDSLSSQIFYYYFFSSPFYLSLFLFCMHFNSARNERE